MAFAGGTVLVSNGVYQAGQRVLYGLLTNRVAVTRPLALQSVNGAAATMIDGGNALRCLYLTNHVSVTGITLQNGTGLNGGGVYCESADDILSNCVLIGNSAVAGGSGGGDWRNVEPLHAGGYSADYLGGGANGSILNFCMLSNNVSANNGGAAAWCTINNSIISSNRNSSGGGVNGGVENTASSSETRPTTTAPGRFTAH